MTTADRLCESLSRAEKAYRGRDYEEAFDVYCRLGNEGHTESQLMVGWMLLKGLGMPIDEEQAALWFERAAVLGSAQGNFYHARYLTRIGRYQDARVRYRVAAQADYLPSIFWMGHTAARGQGTERNLEEAYGYLNRAAKRGHVYAIREIGVLDMRGGRGVFWRLIGVLEYLVAIVGAFLVTLINRDADVLRA